MSDQMTAGNGGMGNGNMGAAGGGQAPQGGGQWAPSDGERRVPESALKRQAEDYNAKLAELQAQLEKTQKEHKSLLGNFEALQRESNEVKDRWEWSKVVSPYGIDEDTTEFLRYKYQTAVKGVEGEKPKPLDWFKQEAEKRPAYLSAYLVPEEEAGAPKGEPKKPEVPKPVLSVLRRAVPETQPKTEPAGPPDFSKMNREEIVKYLESQRS